MTAIYKRELKTFFTTVTGWLFIAAHICLAELFQYPVFAAVIDTDSVHAYAGRGA